MTIKTLLLSTAVLATVGLGGAIGAQSASADSNQGQTYVKNIDVQIPTKGKDGGVWTRPYGQNGASYLGNVRDIAGQKVAGYSAYKDTDSGVLWVEINYHGQRGFVDSNTLTQPNDVGSVEYYTNDQAFITNQNQSAIVHSTASWDNRFSNDWGRDKDVTFGGYSGIVGSLNPYNGKAVKVSGSFVDKNGTTWSRISPLDNVNDFSWVDASRLEMKNTKAIELANTTNHTYKVQIKSNMGDVWTRPYGLDNSQYMRSVSSLGNQLYDVDKVVSVGERGKDTIQEWVHLTNVGWVHRNTVKFINFHQGGHYVTDPKWHTTSYVEDQYDPFMYGGISGSTLSRGYDGLPGFDNWYY